MEALDGIYIDANSERCTAMLQQKRSRCQWCNATLSIYHSATDDLCWPCQHRKETLSDAKPEKPRSRNKPWDIRYEMVVDEMRVLQTFSGRMLLQRMGMDWPVIARALLQAVGAGVIEYDGPAAGGQRSRYRWVQR